MATQAMIINNNNYDNRTSQQRAEITEHVLRLF